MNRNLSFNLLIKRMTILIVWVFLIFFFLKAPVLLFSKKNERKTLHIFSWPEVLNPEIVKEFEKKTGIKVTRHYYTSNEELFTKLKVTKGEGYDLVIPSDYTVKKLIKENLLQPLDHLKLNFIENLNSQLMHQYFDQENIYSIPFIWEVMGFGITDISLAHSLSWKDVFMPKPNHRISMINDPIETIDLAARFLFKEQDSLDAEKVKKITSLLIEQKKYVEAYAGLRGDYLLVTKNCSIAVLPSSYLLRSSQSYPQLKFVIPDDYSFMNIENFCIPKTSKNSELVYQFLNYLYQPQVYAKEANTFYNFPAREDVYPLINASNEYLHCLNKLHQYKGKLFFTRELLPEKESRQIWVHVKS